jgi:hypothetical protein
MRLIVEKYGFLSNFCSFSVLNELKEIKQRGSVGSCTVVCLYSSRHAHTLKNKNEYHTVNKFKQVGAKKK